MKYFHSIYVFFVIIFSLTFASGIALAEETSSIDSSTAKADTDASQEEKKSDDDKPMKGILGYTPVGIIVNAVDGATKDDDSQKELQTEEQNKTETVDE